MNIEDRLLTDRKSVLEYLFEVRKCLLEQFRYELSGVYVYGSIINEDGQGYSTLYSDVDFTLITRSGDLYERVKFLLNLRKEIVKVEQFLRNNLKERVDNKLVDRTFFPVVSVCLATEFELANGIHKNRNAADAFAIRAFHSLDSHESKIKDIGGRLSTDLVGVNFPAWAILTEVQEVRSVFVTPGSSVDEIDLENEAFNHPHLPLPKELLRYSYLLDCFIANRNTEMVVEDDLAKGLTFIQKQLAEASTRDIAAAKAYGDIEVKAGFAKNLFDKIESNVTRKHIVRQSISAEEQMYLWELLAEQAEIALEKRRIDSNRQELELAAAPVVLELSRLRATTLMSVDMAISLAYKQAELLHDGLLSVKIMEHQSIDLYDFKSLDANRLEELLKDDWPDDIRRFLRKQFLEGKDCGESESKIGFAGYLYTQRNQRQQPKVLIRPLTYWIIQQYNKQMATNPRDPELRQFREFYGSRLFSSTEDFNCRCPSAFYIEVAIVTKDNSVFKIPKLAANSAFAKQHGGKVFTSGIEWGFSWKRHVTLNADEAYIDVKKALMEGLENEFSIQPSHVREWNVSTLAIQHTHLNAGLLGVVYLNLNRGDLHNLYAETRNKYYDADNEIFTSKTAALQSVQSDKSSGKWHQSALMRINLIE